MSPGMKNGELVLSVFPVGTEIRAVEPYRPGYRQFPARVTVWIPGGSTQGCVLKMGAALAGLELEAGVLRALAEIGLPVPRVLAGPEAAAGPEGATAAMVLSEVPGRPLPWIDLSSLEEADLSCRLLIRGVRRLHELTETLAQHPIAEALPRVTLSSEWDELRAENGEWLRDDRVAAAAERLSRALEAIRTPLVFSSGDYNPLNFLHDGEALTGWVDFAAARFEDPHVGFAKFLIWSFDAYGWGTGARAGLVERYLYAQNVSRREFAPRLVLRCLAHLQREVSRGGPQDEAARRHMLATLEEALAALP